MKPLNEKMYRKSIFADFDESKRRINSISSRWNKKGILVTAIAYTKRLRDSLKVCPFVDNWLHLHGRSNALGVCCGSIEMPVYSDNPQMEHWNSFPFRYFRYLHSYLNRQKLPYICKNCRALNLKEFSRSFASLFRQSKNKKEISADPLALYSTASSLKKHNRIGEAEKLFWKVLKLKPSPELTGKAYFHLGEIQLKRKKLRQALRFMKSSIQYCFNHAMAFAYLYLLMMLLGEKKIVRKRRKFRIKVPQ